MAKESIYHEWESNRLRGLLIKTIGYWFGKGPEKRINEIRARKQKEAEYIIGKINLSKNDVVLEIGSGPGMISKVIAGAIKELHCCDVSESFLNFAKKECKGIKNIRFYKIDKKPASLEFIDSNSIDAAFARAVFLHLNLFDIFWYFDEFKRVIKPKGRLLFDVAVCDDNFNPRKDPSFLRFAEYYKIKNGVLGGSMYWNSEKAIVGIAKHFGFRLKNSENKGTYRKFLSFEKNEKS